LSVCIESEKLNECVLNTEWGEALNSHLNDATSESMAFQMPDFQENWTNKAVVTPIKKRCGLKRSCFLPMAEVHSMVDNSAGICHESHKQGDEPWYRKTLRRHGIQAASAILGPTSTQAAFNQQGYHHGTGMTRGNAFHHCFERLLGNGGACNKINHPQLTKGAR